MFPFFALPSRAICPRSRWPGTGTGPQPGEESNVIMTTLAEKEKKQHDNNKIRTGHNRGGRDLLFWAPKSIRVEATNLHGII